MSTRRALLRLGGGVLGVGLAGCVTLGQQSAAATPRLVDLTVANNDFRPYQIHALFVEDDEPIYYDSIEATAADPERNSVGGGSFEGYPTEPEDATLYAWRDEQSTAKWISFEFSEYDTPCLSVRINIGTIDHENRGELSFWRSTDPKACDDG